MFDFNHERKEKYFQRAKEKLMAAGFDQISIDTTTITICHNEIARVFTIPWNKNKVSRDRLRELKGLEGFTIMHDRFTKPKPGKDNPPKDYEAGYFEMELDEEDK